MHLLCDMLMIRTRFINISYGVGNFRVEIISYAIAQDADVILATIIVSIILKPIKRGTRVSAETLQLELSSII